MYMYEHILIYIYPYIFIHILIHIYMYTHLVFGATLGLAGKRGNDEAGDAIHAVLSDCCPAVHRYPRELLHRHLRRV